MLAGLLAYTSDPTQPTNPNVGVARASHNPDEPLIILGPESDPIGYLFQDTAGGIILQDATSGNHFWYNQNEDRWETDAELDVPALVADQLNTEDLAAATAQDVLAVGASPPDLQSVNIIDSIYWGWPVWLLEKTTGGGSVTLPGESPGVHKAQLREPGDASGGSESRFYDLTTPIDPSTPWSLRFHVSNIVIDNSSSARLTFNITSGPDQDSFGSVSDQMTAQVQGNGDILAATENDTTIGSTTDSSQGNAYVQSLETVTLSWDGSTFTVETDDGSTPVAVSDSSNYPAGEDLFLKVGVLDAAGTAARNADMDIGRIEAGV